MKITRKHLRRLIRESISNTRIYHNKYNEPPGQIPYDHPRMKLRRAVGDEKMEKIDMLSDSDDEENRVMASSLIDALGYESEFGDYAEDEFEHDVRMAAKDHDEKRRELRPTVHSFMSHMIGNELETAQATKNMWYSPGDEEYNVYNDIETYMTQLLNKKHSPREALDELLNKINQEGKTLPKKMLHALKRLMKTIATESLEAGFINRGVAMRYVGPDIQHYPTREDQRKNYPHKGYTSDRYRK